MVIDWGAKVLRALPPEDAHAATIRLTGALSPLLPKAKTDDARLAVPAFGLTFPNPIGLAAGFDKNAAVSDAMLKFGFGFVECGTVTPRPQTGNPRPRLFRLVEDRAVINRMGFNNDGMDAVAARLARRKHTGIVGINIGANKDSADRIGDYSTCFARLAPLADYVVINVSSPNTPGLRALQNRAELELLLGRMTDERARLGLNVPLLLKIAPDLEDGAVDDVAEVAFAHGLQGIVATNTTIARLGNLRSAHATEVGGLSGAPLFARSTEVLKRLRRRLGSKLVLVGVGGVQSGADAYAKIRAGAALVQLYSALVYEGPGLIARIKNELLALLARDGFSSAEQAVGVDAD